VKRTRIGLERARLEEPTSRKTMTHSRPLTRARLALREPPHEPHEASREVARFFIFMHKTMTRSMKRRRVRGRRAKRERKRRDRGREGKNAENAEIDTAAVTERRRGWSGARPKGNMLLGVTRFGGCLAWPRQERRSPAFGSRASGLRAGSVARLSLCRTVIQSEPPQKKIPEADKWPRRNRCPDDGKKTTGVTRAAASKIGAGRGRFREERQRNSKKGVRARARGEEEGNTSVENERQNIGRASRTKQRQTERVRRPCALQLNTNRGEVRHRPAMTSREKRNELVSAEKQRTDDGVWSTQKRGGLATLSLSSDIKQATENAVDRRVQQKSITRYARWRGRSLRKRLLKARKRYGGVVSLVGGVSTTQESTLGAH